MKSYSEVIKAIKKWTKHNRVKKYLFVAELARGRMGTDNDDDLYCVNEDAFDAFFDITALRNAFRRAKSRYNQHDAYVEDLFDGDGERM